MRNKKTPLVVGSIALALAAGGAVAAAQGSDGPPTDQGHVLVQETATGQLPVGDSEGVVRGTVDTDAMDKASRAAGDFLSDHDLTLAKEVDGRIVTNKDVAKLSDAVMVLEAAPVYGPDGKVVGHFGARFIEEGDYAALRADAEALVLKVTGETYGTN